MKKRSFQGAVQLNNVVFGCFNNMKFCCFGDGAHGARNSKLWKRVCIYILECHMEVNETILKIP